MNEKDARLLDATRRLLKDKSDDKQIVQSLMDIGIDENKAKDMLEMAKQELLKIDELAELLRRKMEGRPRYAGIVAAIEAYFASQAPASKSQAKRVAGEARRSAEGGGMKEAK